MKIVYAFAFSVLTTLAFGQETKELKKEVRKEVKMELVNGEEVLTITTTENGKVTEEVFKGAEAEKKMNELNAAQSSSEIREEVKMEEINGEKVLTIVRTENGVTKTEVFKGAEAEARMKEIEAANGTAPKNMQMKKLEVKKLEAKEKN